MVDHYALHRRRPTQCPPARPSCMHVVCFEPTGACCLLLHLFGFVVLAWGTGNTSTCTIGTCPNQPINLFPTPPARRNAHRLPALALFSPSCLTLIRYPARHQCAAPHGCLLFAFPSSLVFPSTMQVQPCYGRSSDDGWYRYPFHREIKTPPPSLECSILIFSPITPIPEHLYGARGPWP